jgi:hypothetical protein
MRVVLDNKWWCRETALTLTEANVLYMLKYNIVGNSLLAHKTGGLVPATLAMALNSSSITCRQQGVGDRVD